MGAQKNGEKLVASRKQREGGYAGKYGKVDANTLIRKVGHVRSHSEFDQLNWRRAWRNL